MKSTMPQIELKVMNKLGLHARPAAKIVETTKKFKSEITISKNDVQINAKSIMGVMMLAAEAGSTLIISAEGEDAQEALKEVAILFERKFDEE
jgi:phosphocarrier protein HPr